MVSPTMEGGASPSPPTPQPHQESWQRAFWAAVKEARPALEAAAHQPLAFGIREWSPGCFILEVSRRKDPAEPITASATEQLGTRVATEEELQRQFKFQLGRMIPRMQQRWNLHPEV